MTLKVAYLINQYPKVSHTFIRREILALERLGVCVTRLALRGWADEVVDDQDRKEREQTRYVLRCSPIVGLLGILKLMLKRPVCFATAFIKTLRLGWRADRPLLIHLIYFAEACLIVPWLQAAKVDHVHAHFGTNSALVALLIKALGGPAFSFTVHGPEEFDKPQFLKLAAKVHAAAFVVAISSFGRSQLYRWVTPHYWPKIRVVHCGVELSAFAKQISPPSGQRLVCVGRLCEQKGQILLLQATHLLVQRGILLELVLAGDGEMRAELESIIAQLNLSAFVRITGWISGEQVQDELLAARALVMPSFAEGLPVVMMEAMALGRPVIATYIAGIPELVRNGLEGWLFPAGDVEALAQAMTHCLSAPNEHLDQLSHNAIKRVHERHNIDTEAAKLKAIIEESL